MTLGQVVAGQLEGVGSTFGVRWALQLSSNGIHSDTRRRLKMEYVVDNFTSNTLRSMAHEQAVVSILRV